MKNIALILISVLFLITICLSCLSATAIGISEINDSDLSDAGFEDSEMDAFYITLAGTGLDSMDDFPFYVSFPSSNF